MICLDVAKTHLRVDYDDEDMVIQIYLSAAIDYAKAFLNRDIIASEEDRLQDTDIVMNDAIRSAILLILGHLYENRENEIVDHQSNPLQFGAKSLLYPYRIKLGV